ncbi:hypothetical protein TNIN_192061 [Trichonephila inaurata madagascariensis]|uniref:Uncharacterized protein n=1 Tax=Trichonephila inaurata madagascariensis TaxID=2747483 RepID=A0A8X6WPH1_9ARAC|nr:hypothetical protein TNIN_192061 [Trichonephila inaurata madagascariensis]
MVNIIIAHKSRNSIFNFREILGKLKIDLLPSSHHGVGADSGKQVSCKLASPIFYKSINFSQYLLPMTFNSAVIYIRLALKLQNCDCECQRIKSQVPARSGKKIKYPQTNHIGQFNSPPTSRPISSWGSRMSPNID